MKSWFEKRQRNFLVASLLSAFNLFIYKKGQLSSVFPNSVDYKTFCNVRSNVFITQFEKYSTMSIEKRGKVGDHFDRWYNKEWLNSKFIFLNNFGKPETGAYLKSKRQHTISQWWIRDIFTKVRRKKKKSTLM